MVPRVSSAWAVCLAASLAFFGSARLFFSESKDGAAFVQAVAKPSRPGTFYQAVISGGRPAPSTQPATSLAGQRSSVLPLLASAACAVLLARAQVIRRVKGKPQTTSGIRIRTPKCEALRNASIATFEECTTKQRYEPLTVRLVRAYGRDRRGRIISAARIGRQSGRLCKGSTLQNPGGTVRKAMKYRIIDFGRKKRGMFAEIETVEYDPFRNARICLVKYEDGERRYILHAIGYFIGQQIISDEDAPAFVGNAMAIGNVPLGTMVHNIESRPGSGGGFVRAAGTSAYVLAHSKRETTVTLPSSEVRLFPNSCWCTIGKVGRVEAQTIKLGKAGKIVHLGRNERNRGKSMNACDHPHGGGEGKSPIGHKHRKTPFGQPVWKRTRNLSRFGIEKILVPSWKKSGRARNMK